MLLMLMVSLILLTVTAAYLYLFKKPLKDYRQSQQTLTMLQRETQPDGISLASRLAALQSSNAELDRKIHGAAPQLPLNQMIARVIGELDRIADRHAVELDSVKPGKVAMRSMFQEVPFQVEITGPYLNLYDWLDDVERKIGPIVVRQFTLEPIAGTMARHLQLTLVSYRFKTSDD